MELFLEDLLSSYWNQIDGITINGVTIPAAFTSIVADGDTLIQFIQALLDRINAVQVEVTGGVQGKVNEFLSIITSDTNQTFLIDENNSPYNTFRDAGDLKFVNDKDNGGFDNGNNFLVDSYIVPVGGLASADFKGNGIVFELLEENLVTTRSRTIKLEVSYNGSTWGTAQEFTINPGDTIGTKYYFNDFGNSGVAFATAGLPVSIKLMQKQSVVSSGSIRLKLINGFFNNKIN
jgi:hypothetical protein